MTDNGLLLTRSTGIGGEQRLYRWGNWGLSVVNGAMLHFYPFAREAAVVHFTDEHGPNDFDISYETTLTSDVEVFSTDEAADEFVEQARAYFESADLVALEAAAKTAKVEREASRKRLLDGYRNQPAASAE